MLKIIKTIKKELKRREKDTVRKTEMKKSLKLKIKWME